MDTFFQQYPSLCQAAMIRLLKKIAGFGGSYRRISQDRSSSSRFSGAVALDAYFVTRSPSVVLVRLEAHNLSAMYLHEVCDRLAESRQMIFNREKSTHSALPDW